MEAVQFLKEELEKHGENVIICDLCREDVSYAVADAFQYDRLVLAASSYDGGMFCPMEEFLHHLKSKNFQNRLVAFIENGTWAPCASKAMKEIVSTMKNMDDLGSITIKGAMKKENQEALRELSLKIVDGGCVDEACV